jgi:hypothetical protein
MKEAWLFQGAVVPVDTETTQALVAEIKRLIDVVGGMALECPNCEYHRQRAQRWREEAYKLSGHPLPEQEPVGYASEGAAERLTTVKQAHEQIRSFRLFTHDVPLYTAPQRTWVGLTEDEAFACQGRDYFETYRAIEAKLKEKNT